jgi:hypothetical protein
VIAAGILLACAALAAAYQTGASRARANLAGPAGAADRLWRQMFGTRPLTIVVGDATLTLLQDAAHYQFTVSEYQRQSFSSLAAERLPEGHRPWAWRLMNRHFTSLTDTSLAARISALRAAEGGPSEIAHARQVAPGLFEGHDVVLAGPRRANPWVEVFEPHLAFRTHFEEGTRRCWFENVSPQPGESAEYEVTWNEVGYCRVAYLPSLSGTGTVLLVSGTDMSSTEAGAELITSDRWVQSLLERLGATTGPIPHFEVLLRAHLVLTASTRLEVVAHRRLP